MQFNYVVTEKEDGRTLRSILSRELNISSTMIKKIKLYGQLQVNGAHAAVVDTVKAGDRIYACYDDDVGILNRSPLIPVLYEDDYLAVVIKPAGMVTHPSHGHLDDSLLYSLNPSPKPLHPVMRLDRETSGLIIVAKSGHIHKLFSEQEIRKEYIAAVYGKFNPLSGTIDKPIKRREGSVMIRDVFPEGTPGANRSVTHYDTLALDEDLDISLVRFVLETGRCHQIRVHSRSEGHPLVGDGLYGPMSDDNPSDSYPLCRILEEKCPRVALHAYKLVFSHPVTRADMYFESPVPDDIRNLSPEFLDHLAGKGL